MRKGLAALIAFGVTASSAVAAAPATWQGVVQIVSINDHCSHPAPGSKLPSIFRQSLGGAVGPAGLTLLESINKLYLLSVTASDQKFGANGLLAEKAISNWATYYEVSGITYAFAYDPPLAEITAKSPFIDLTGSLSNFDNQAGCVLKFRAGYAKVVE
jgi:hypothetical protein